MSEEIFVAYETSVKDYVETMQNRNTREKTKEDVQLCEEILRKENVRREAHTIAPTELNKYLAEFFRSVRRINERGLWALKFTMTTMSRLKQWKAFEEKWLLREHHQR